MIGSTAMMGPFMWFFMVLLVILTIMGVIYLIKWASSRTRSGQEDQDSPLNILKTRYAKGEITDVEFEEMRQKLAVK